MANTQLTKNRKTRIAILIGVSLCLAFVVNADYWLKQAQYALEEESDPLSSSLSSPAPYKTMEPNRLVIERLRIDAPILFVDQPDEAVFQRALRDGVVHYPGTAKIGELGNPFIFGHSSDYIWARGSYKTVFALLPKIQKDDIIIASDENGHGYQYKVIETRIVPPDAFEYLDQQDYKKRMLTVQTSYPIGTALKRFMVVAEMVQ